MESNQPTKKKIKINVFQIKNLKKTILCVY